MELFFQVTEKIKIQQLVEIFVILKGHCFHFFKTREWGAVP